MYYIRYSDGCVASKRVNSLHLALIEASRLINKKGMREVEVFNMKSGFHSTTQREFLLFWWGENSYWGNMAKQDSSLYEIKL